MDALLSYKYIKVRLNVILGIIDSSTLLVSFIPTSRKFLRASH